MSARYLGLDIGHKNYLFKGARSVGCRPPTSESPGQHLLPEPGSLSRGPARPHQVPARRGRRFSAHFGLLFPPFFPLKMPSTTCLSVSALSSGAPIFASRVLPVLPHLIADSRASCWPAAMVICSSPRPPGGPFSLTGALGHHPLRASFSAATRSQACKTTSLCSPEAAASSCIDLFLV